MYLRALTAAVLVLTVSAGCSPLQEAVKGIAPTYEAKQPALNAAGLGHRIVSRGTMDTNECYAGEHSSTATGWSAIKITYKGNAKADLSADFGKTLTVNASGSSDINSEVALNQISEDSLDSLSLNLNSTCLSKAETLRRYMDGTTDEVIVRALKASQVQITENDANSAKIDVHIPINLGGVGGSLSGSSESTKTWSGTGLFFAHQVKKFNTKLERKTFTAVPIGGSTGSLGTCTFTLNGVNLGTNNWDGSLNCLGGGTHLNGSFSGYERTSENGVSHEIGRAHV